MQLIIDSEPGLAIEKDMSAIGDIEKVGNGNIGQLSGNNCNGNKENIKVVNIITNDKQSIDVDAGPETQSEIKPVNPELKICKIKTEGTNDSVVNGEVTKESQSNSCNGKSVTTPVSAKEPIVIKQEVIDSKSNSNVNNKDQNKDSAAETSSNKDIASADHTKAVCKVEVVTDEVDAATHNVGPVSDTDKILSPITKVEMTTDDVEAVCVKIEGNTDDTADLSKPASDSVTPAVVKVEVAMPGPKDDVQVIEDPVEIKEDPDVVLSEESEHTKKVDLTENDKKDDNSPVTVEITDTEPVALSNEAPIELKDDMDVEVIEEPKTCEQSSVKPSKDTSSTPSNIVEQPVVCKLSNTLDILSDDDEEPPKKEPAKVQEKDDKQCINIEDDDDIMLIDEDTSKTETPPTVNNSVKEGNSDKADGKTDSETGEKPLGESDLFANKESQDLKPAEEVNSTAFEIDISEKQEIEKIQEIEPELPLIPDNFLKSAKKNIADMTREDLEEFCILKIVESIVDRSSLSDIKQKLKTVAQGVEEYRKKVTMLTKQNLDLQVVLKSIQEEQKKVKPDAPITPLKITRSVGMQVYMEKTTPRRKAITQPQQSQSPSNPTQVASRQSGKVMTANTSSPRPQKPLPSNQNIPVPRLVPANSPAIKSPSSIPLVVNQTTPGKTGTPMPNGVKNPSPLKPGEKRQHSRVMSVTVDLTDDEPPAKVNNRTSPAPPVRVVPSQNLMPASRQSYPVGVNNSPRKVYIPISGQQNQNIRPGQTIMLKAVGSPGLRPKGPTPPVARVQSSSIRMTSNVRPQSSGRHPAPLPDAMKQYQPPNWKALPPAPEIKLSKVENGIVISWKIESYQEDCHEEIASYQLYAYQETSCPPSTTLWKKIGDVKALPLPMACTLTQFMAGFKYYFAVRAVDIRSRLGPFSLPGSILLLNKL